MKRTLILLSVLGLMLGACGKDDNKSNASNDDDTVTTVKEDSGSGDEADGALKAKLLKASDLPDGFELQNSEERDPSEGDDSEDNDFCPELSTLDKDYPGEREAEADFQREGGEGASMTAVTLNEQLTRFADEDEADEAFSAFEEGFPKCKSFTETDESDGSTTTGSFEKIDFAKAGDDTYGTELTIKQSGADGQSLELKGHFVALREGKHVIILMTVGFGDELSLKDFEAVAKAAAKAAA